MVFLSILAFMCGVFFVILPITIPAEVSETQDTTDSSDTDSITADYPGYVDSAPADSVPADYTGRYDSNFAVEISPWTPSSLGERVQVSITNIGNQTYDWAMLNVIFVDEIGNVIKTERGGAYSQIRPNDTVNIYMLAAGMENVRGFVYSVESDRFIYDPETGLISNY